MKQRILVALDLLELDVFETALSLAMAMDADILLLHVLSVNAVNSPMVPFGSGLEYTMSLSQHTWDLYRQQWQVYVEDGLATLRDYTGRAEAAGITADFMQSLAEPGAGICDMARTWKADMIIMGSHQRKGLRELLLGSVSNYVMHHAPCSVMIVSLENKEHLEENVALETTLEAASV